MSSIAYKLYTYSISIFLNINYTLYYIVSYIETIQ